MTLWTATTNTHKVKEITSFFRKDLTVRILSLSDIKDFVKEKTCTPPEETGRSFQENAQIKSKGLLKFLKNALPSAPEQFWILGEDSGLEVKALNGRPGVRSARYSGPKASDQKNNRLLLKNLAGQTNRKARYVCALSCLLLTKDFRILKELLFEGFCKGSVAFKEEGSNGFGYDSLFIPRGETKTLGVLPPAFKEKISHRVKALKQFKEALKAADSA